MLTTKNWLGLALITLIGLLGLYPFYLPEQEHARAYGFFGLTEKDLSELAIVEQTTLLPLSTINHKQATKKMKVVATAYSPSVDETDDTPFLTASGNVVRDGIIANNSLPFGTKVRFPELFPHKIFVVEDRMHWRLGANNVDLFFFSKQDALNFGARYTEMEILD
ncbi:MAG: 3D domain-containing protein [Candidatus Pacebacteria bacterium]|nr:3D domain-containing protein [Candidatus Paceibacterota bacterium]